MHLDSYLKKEPYVAFFIAATREKNNIPSSKFTYFLKYVDFEYILGLAE